MNDAIMELTERVKKNYKDMSSTELALSILALKMDDLLISIADYESTGHYRDLQEAE